MTAAKIATAIVLLSTFAHCQAQNVSPLQPMKKTSVVVATQINSPKNYALLQPIANKPVQRRFSHMLKPIETKAPTTNATTGDLVVVPHSFQRGVFDQHKFMVRNDGKKSLKSGKISLQAPAGSIIQQVVPKPDSVSGLKVELTIGELVPGEHQIVLVAIKYPRNELAHFESTIVAQNWIDPNSKVKSDVASEAGRMLEPRSTGMLKPKVPVMTVSATKARVATNDQRDDPPTSVPVPVLDTEVEPLAMEVEPVAPDSSGIQDEQEASPAEETVEFNTTIEASLRGPDSVEAGEEVEFSIEVKNLSSEFAKGVIVQLSVPEQLKATVLDRAAWYDNENRKLSWELAELGPGTIETIRYKAIVKTGCSVEQVVVTGLGNQFQCKSTMQTTAK